MRKVVDYTIVLARKDSFTITHSQLIGYIKDMLKEGWIPVGGLSLDHHGDLLQAMVKYEEESPDFSQFDCDEVRLDKICNLQFKEEIKMGSKVDVSLKVRIVKIGNNHVLVSLFDRSGEEVEVWIPKSEIKKAE